MAITDLVTLSISIFLLNRGSSRGFMNSLLGPFSLVVATIFSIIYYQQTKAMVASLTIGLIGPFVLQMILKILLRAWSVATNTDIKPNFLSRLGGAILTLVWGWVFIVIFLVLLSVIPPFGKTLTDIRDDVQRSRSYSIAKPLQDSLMNASRKTLSPAVKTTPAEDVKSLTDDPRFQSVFKDPEIQKEVEAHDFGKLMSNPKIMELTKQLMSDPVALQKVMAFYGSNQKELQMVMKPQEGQAQEFPLTNSSN